MGGIPTVDCETCTKRMSGAKAQKKREKFGIDVDYKAQYVIMRSINARFMVFHPFTSFGPSLQAGVLQQDVVEALPFEMQRLRQVHGTAVVEVESIGEEVEGDALITRSNWLPLLIKTADCIPLVFADEVTGWIGGIHAGWRGLTADIIPLTFARMVEKGVQMANVKVGIGPSLGLECAQFSHPQQEIPAQYHWAIREHSHVDLWAILERQLAQSGILWENIEWMRVCTACNPEWFSWRRDADARRFGTFIVKGVVKAL